MPTGESLAAESSDSPLVRIDRSRTPQRWRYLCPEGHSNWDRTNNHIWCRSCRRANEAGEDIDPEHYVVLDVKTGEEIPWSRIEIVES